MTGMLAPQCVPAQQQASPPDTRILTPRPDNSTDLHRSSTGSLDDLLKPVSSVSIRAPEGPLPEPVSPSIVGPHSEGTFTPRCYQWRATELAYRPLHFEEPSLERYGHTGCECLQSVKSGVRFFGTFPVLPYQVALEDPWVWALGHERPGNCVVPRPKVLDLDNRAAAVQAAAVVGLIFIIP